jgi:nucleoside-diphosphate-sugar epimerase
MSARTVALVGSHGFVGGAVKQVLVKANDLNLKTAVAPRLTTVARGVDELIAAAQRADALQALSEAFEGVDVVINAAGNPDASAVDLDGLFGANALLPRVLYEAAAKASATRFIHVSSAVVQNARAVLDESEDMEPFSPYSASKVAGERVLRGAADGLRVVRFRPPSVHASGRRVTERIRRIASSPLASVARPGTQPTPQALLPNVAAAIAFLATTDCQPPAVVTYPSEGLTALSLLQTLGGREPTRIPRWMAKGAVGAARAMGRWHAPTAANARRVEVLWLGQGQDEGWLSSVGWEPPVGHEGWAALGATTRASARDHASKVS